MTGLGCFMNIPSVARKRGVDVWGCFGLVMVVVDSAVEKTVDCLLGRPKLVGSKNYLTSE